MGIKESRISRFKEDGTVNSPENPLSIEMIRWTFMVSPTHRVEIETYLLDLGLEIQARGDDVLVVTWDEPEGGIGELIEELWAINAEPFEITHEGFHRVNLLSITPKRPKRSTAQRPEISSRHRVDPPDRTRRPSRRFALRRRPARSVRRCTAGLIGSGGRGPRWQDRFRGSGRWSRQDRPERRGGWRDR